MNIDIINKQVSKKLSIDEKKVALVNQFYWNCNRKHIYDFNPAPLDITYLFVIHPDKYMVKRFIKKYISKIRYTLHGNRFRQGSILQKNYVENYRSILRGFLKIRKANKWVN